MNHPGAFGHPLSASQDMYEALDIGPVGAPPPVNFPGAYSNSAEGLPGLAPMMDAGPRFPIFPVGHPRGNLTAPYNANARGICKRFDKKVKPL